MLAVVDDEDSPLLGMLEVEVGGYAACVELPGGGQLAHDPGEMSRQFRMVAVIVAGAAIAFVVYQNHRHHHLKTGIGGPAFVLVAKKQIPKGTTGNNIQTPPVYYEVAGVTAIPMGAITDPSKLVGKVAVKEIPAGQPLTAADFGPLGKRRVLFPKKTTP